MNYKLKVVAIVGTAATAVFISNLFAQRHIVIAYKRYTNSTQYSSNYHEIK